MESVIVSPDGQLTVPEAVRQAMGLENGGKINFFEFQHGLFLICAVTSDLKRLEGALRDYAVPRPVTVDEMNEAIAAAAASSGQ